jgi:methionyl-tRNA synthetase
MRKKYLITSALPYANGPLHFGHLTGVYIPADIYTRHRRLQGHEVLHICGSDEHGVAIMISAEKEKMSYQDYVDHWHGKHRDLFRAFQIDFDFFGRTSQDYHREEVLKWFSALHENGLIGKKTEKQLFCVDDNKFLPDRYAEGTCYLCKYPNARGDECPNCGEWIDPIRLIQPRSKISGSTQIEIRETEQYYLLLTKLVEEFKKWFATKAHWRNVVTGFVEGLLEQGLIDRAISRDLSWGIDVPLPEAQGKKLYVWFDAPIGYVSITKKMLDEKGNGQDYLADWWNNPSVEISHFIGKDNIIFHALIWPCMILGSKFVQPPTEIPANQFLNLAGKQFSKSTGWYVDAEKALAEFGADSLRFYLCSAIPENSDSSFTWKGFASSHEEFGNKIGNFVHRSLSFLDKNWPEGLSAEAFVGAEKNPQFATIEQYHQKIISALDSFQFTKYHQEVIQFSQAANEYFHAQEPWKQIKQDRAAAEQTLAISMIYLTALAIFIEPVVPGISSKILAHFEGYLDRDSVARIYQGNLGLLVKAFNNGFKNRIAPQVLLPRLEKNVLIKWESELQEKETASAK